MLPHLLLIKIIGTLNNLELAQILMPLLQTLCWVATQPKTSISIALSKLRAKIRHKIILSCLLHLMVPKLNLSTPLCSSGKHKKANLNTTLIINSKYKQQLLRKYRITYSYHLPIVSILILQCRLLIISVVVITTFIVMACPRHKCKPR